MTCARCHKHVDIGRRAASSRGFPIVDYCSIECLLAAMRAMMDGACSPTN